MTKFIVTEEDMKRNNFFNQIKDKEIKLSAAALCLGYGENGFITTSLAYNSQR